MALKDSETNVANEVVQLGTDIGDATTFIAGQLSSASAALSSGDYDTALANITAALSNTKTLNDQQLAAATALDNCFVAMQSANEAIVSISKPAPLGATTMKMKQAATVVAARK